MDMSLSLFHSLSLSLPPSFSLFLSLTSEVGVRALFTGQIQRERERKREIKREREREREKEGERVAYMCKQKVQACSKHSCGRALSVPHSVCQSACVING